MGIHRPKEGDWEHYDEPKGRVEMIDGRKGTIIGYGHFGGPYVELMWVIELDNDEGLVWGKK